MEVIRGITPTAYGGMNIHNNATPKVIDTTAVEHAIEGLSGNNLKGFTFQASERQAITAAATAAGGAQTTFTSAGHSLVAGEIVTLSGFSVPAYNVVKEVLSISGNDFTVVIAFDSDVAGVFCRGSNLTVGKAGVYYASYALSATSDAGANKDFSFHIFTNAAEDEVTHSERRFAIAADRGSICSSGIIVLALGDIVWFSINNETDATDFTMRNGSITLHRIGG